MLLNSLDQSKIDVVFLVGHCRWGGTHSYVKKEERERKRDLKTSSDLKCQKLKINQSYLCC